jgi:hypothetical protein
MSRIHVAWLLSLLIVFFVLSSFAQTPVATLVGRVLDSTGGAVPEAQITVRNVDTGQKRAAATGPTGDFTVTYLPAGNYEVVVEKEGFRRLVESGLTLQVAQTARLELKLQLGSVVQAVQVIGEVPLLTTESPVKGDVIISQEINEMPLNGRNFSDLAYLIPGVMPQTQGSDEGSPYAISGARMDNTNFVVDGFNNQRQRDGNAQVSPPLDAMQEFRVQTTGYSAEYGRLAGGVISMALKTGTNRYHGTLSEFIRNDAFDARSFFSIDKAKLRRNQFGASLNGPIKIPKLYNGQDRTFFLVTWESTRQYSGTNKFGVVPTALERDGDFSQSVDTSKKPVWVKDPLLSGTCSATNQAACFPGNKIPASRIHPVTIKALAYYPLPNCPPGAAGCGTNNYYASGNAENTPDNYLFKVDHRLSDRDNISFRLAMPRGASWNPFDGSELNFGGGTITRAYLYGLSYTRSFSPAMLIEIRLGFTRNFSRSWGQYDGRNMAAELGLPVASSDPRSLGFPRFEPSDMSAIGDGKNAPTAVFNNVWQYADTVTWSKSRHLAKFGVDVLRSQFFEPYNLRVRGSVAFKGSWSSVPFADMLLGLPSSSQRQLGGAATNYLFTTTTGAFVQDDWKLRPNLTLNLGLRWELMQPPHEKYGRLGNFVPSVAKEIIASDLMVPNLTDKLAAAKLSNSVGLAKDYNLPQSLAPSNYKNFAPRFGFAWRPLGGNRTVVRGGYGLYYGNSATKSVKQDLGNIYPFVIPQTFSRVSSNVNALTLTDPYPAALASITSVTNSAGYDTNAPSQYLQAWNITVERQIGSSAIELGYTGSKGTHLGRRYDLNQPLRQSQYKLPNGTFLRPFSDWSTINYYWFGSNSAYEGASVMFRRRFAKGFFYRVNYVYAKSIDEASQLAGYANNGYGGAQDSRNLGLERGRSDFDRRHAFTVSFTYETQFRNHWLKGWEIATTGRAYSGVGMTPYTNNASLDQGEASRPDRTAFGTLANPTIYRWFDISAFPVVPRGAYRMGNSGRNIIDGPGFFEQNLGLMRKFYFGESRYLQLRWEAFNAPNHTNFRLPELGVDRPNAGTITSIQGSPRSMQFALRLVF